MLVYVPYEYPCTSRREGGKESRDMYMPPNSGSLLVTRHADATGVYRLGWGSLAIIIFDRQLLPERRDESERNNGTGDGDDYNFSVSITVATCLAAIFQRPKVHVSIIAQQYRSHALPARGKNLYEKRK